MPGAPRQASRQRDRLARTGNQAARNRRLGEIQADPERNGEYRTIQSPRKYAAPSRDRVLRPARSLSRSSGSAKARRSTPCPDRCRCRNRCRILLPCRLRPRPRLSRRPRGPFAIVVGIALPPISTSTTITTTTSRKTMGLLVVQGRERTKPTSTTTKTTTSTAATVSGRRRSHGWQGRPADEEKKRIPSVGSDT